MTAHNTERPYLINVEAPDENERIANLISLAQEIYLKTKRQINIDLRLYSDPAGQMLPIPMGEGKIIIITSRRRIMEGYSEEGYSVTTWQTMENQKPLECTGAVQSEGSFSFLKPEIDFKYIKSSNVDTTWIAQVEEALDRTNTRLNSR